MKKLHVLASCHGPLVAVALGVVSTVEPGHCATFLGPAPYLSAADSPFSLVPSSYRYLEDFEDGALNTPGVTASPGWTVLGPAPLTDSVDGDDGAIDSSGTGGHSYFSFLSSSSLTFTFSEVALGGFPTHVGLVWTDVGQASPATGFGLVSFSAKDAFGVALGSIGPFMLGDGVVSGGTAEDRFFGIENSGGVSEITITTANSTDWEVDHLQYLREAAATVPDGGGMQLCLLAGLALAGGNLWTRRLRAGGC